MPEHIRYRCESCGFTHTVQDEEIAGSGMARRMWPKDKRLDRYWPPFLLCGKCCEQRKGKQPTPRMWPVAEIRVNGELTVRHVCKTPNCGFAVEMPSSFPGGWKCPKCRFGIMRRKRWK